MAEASRRSLPHWASATSALSAKDLEKLEAAQQERRNIVDRWMAEWNRAGQVNGREVGSAHVSMEEEALGPRYNRDLLAANTHESPSLGAGRLFNGHPGVDVGTR